jgi:hypothetical protein
VETSVLIPRQTTTPKALANFSPGLERSDNPGVGPLMYIPTLKGFAARGTLSGLTAVFIHLIPELSLRSNSGLKLANAFGVFLSIVDATPQFRHSLLILMN